MKKSKIVLMLGLIVLALSFTVLAEEDGEIIPVLEGSEVRFDDQLGYEQLPLVMDEDTVTVMDGVLRRRWGEARLEITPRELIENYESVIRNKGGEILFMTGEPQTIEIEDREFSEIFYEKRINRGMATGVMTQNSFPELMSQYLLARLETAEADVYVIIGTGRGHWAASQDERLFFEIVTLEIDSMKLDDLFAGEDDELIPIYKGSEVVFDDELGYEQLPLVMDEETVNLMDGVLRRRWCEAPEGRSPLEIIRNYETAVENIGGEVLFVTRDPQAIEIEEREFSDIFSENRINRGLATNVFTQNAFPELMSEYLLGKIVTAEADVYVIIGSGRGHSAAREDNLTFFEIVTLEVEPMEMEMVTLDALKQGLAVQGRVAVYNIYFDTGESQVKAESAEALVIIAEFLQQNPEQEYLVVGHTDNVGGFEMNMDLSEARAEAVVDKLVNDYGISGEQLRAVGVGFAAPVLSNSTKAGRARNRRVEIVER